jgi:hypothetical protein
MRKADSRRPRNCVAVHVPGVFNRNGIGENPVHKIQLTEKPDMKNSFKTFMGIVGLITLSAAASATAALQIETSLDREKMTTDEAAVLTLTVSADQQVEVELPQIDGLQFQARGSSSRMEMINGKVTSSLSRTVLVYAQNPAWSYSQVVNQILSTVHRTSAMNVVTTTGGVLNAFDAVNGGSPPDTTPPAGGGGGVTETIFFGGCESGNFSGWSTSGPPSSHGAHGGDLHGGGGAGLQADLRRPGRGQGGAGRLRGRAAPGLCARSVARFRAE